MVQISKIGFSAKEGDTEEYIWQDSAYAKLENRSDLSMGQNSEQWTPLDGGLTTQKDEENFWGYGTILYLDWSIDYTGVYIC